MTDQPVVIGDWKEMLSEISVLGEPDYYILPVWEILNATRIIKSREGRS